MPNHRTIYAFRRKHLENFRALFVQVVKMAKSTGLVALGVSIDGTKMRTYASKRKAMSYDRMKKEQTRLKVEIDACLAQHTAWDNVVKELQKEKRNV